MPGGCTFNRYLGANRDMCEAFSAKMALGGYSTKVHLAGYQLNRASMIQESLGGRNEFNKVNIGLIGTHGGFSLFPDWMISSELGYGFLSHAFKHIFRCRSKRARIRSGFEFRNAVLEATIFAGLVYSPASRFKTTFGMICSTTEHGPLIRNSTFC